MGERGKERSTGLTDHRARRGLREVCRRDVSRSLPQTVHRIHVGGGGVRIVPARNRTQRGERGRNVLRVIVKLSARVGGVGVAVSELGTIIIAHIHRH